MKIEIIDGTEYEVGTAPHAKAVETRNRIRKDAADALTRETARADAAEAKVKALEEKTAGEESRVAARVAARLALHQGALRAGVEVKADASDEDVRKAVIGKVLPGVSLEGKEPAYVEAMFDVALSQIEASSLGGVRKDAIRLDTKSTEAEAKPKDVEAREKSIARLHGAWRTDTKDPQPGRSVAGVRK